MVGGKSEDPGTKMDIRPTGMGTRIPEEIVVPMERGGDSGLMDPGANPQLKERSPMRERRPTVTGKNQKYCMVDFFFSLNTDSTGL